MTKKIYSSEEMDRYFNDPSYRRSFLGRGKGFLKRNRKFIVGLSIFVIALLSWYGYYIARGLPSLEELENPRPALASKVYAEDGAVLDQFAEQNRTRIELTKIPQGLIDALVATEDKDFYTHWGVNLPRFARQMVINLLTFRQAGASTITQQLARNLYKLQGREESMFDKITRKVREFFTSVQIERNFTKREILELYLNVAFFGGKAYGIESAAQQYFNKSAADLIAPEYTLLVGMLQGPNYYNPFKNYDRALRRRSIVLNQMLHDGKLDAKQVDVIKADSLSFRNFEIDYRVGIAPHFVEWIRQQLELKAETYGFNIYRDGLRIYTSLDSRMQRYANRAVDEHLTGYQEKFDKYWDWKKYPEILESNVDKMIRDLDVFKKAKTPAIRDSIVTALRTNNMFVDSVRKAARNIEVGMVAIDPHNGHIKAMVGGRSFRVFRYGLNHVTQIHRQPGSAFKPFVYTVALDNGTPVTFTLPNQPVTVMMPDGTRWTPQNFDGGIRWLGYAA